jgi:hypothetical protein
MTQLPKHWQRFRMQLHSDIRALMEQVVFLGCAVMCSQKVRYLGCCGQREGGAKKKTVDPEKEAAVINTLRILSEAFSKRIGYNKRKPYKNDAVAINFYKLWSAAGERYGSDMSEFNTYIKDLEQIAKKRGAADTRESNDYDDAALANTLRDLSKSSADWAEKRKSK